jgi:hypothetical protein
MFVGLVWFAVRKAVSLSERYDRTASFLLQERQTGPLKTVGKHEFGQ